MKNRPQRLVTNPFVSEAQRAACHAANDPNWDCDKWEAHTPDKELPKRKKPTTNKKRRKNYDPSRTLSLRQAFVKQVRQRFRVLKGLVYKLIVVDDAFGLKDAEPFTFNATCDPSKLVEVPDVRQPNDFYCGASATRGVAILRGLEPGSIQRVAGELGTTVERSTHPSAIISYFRDRGLAVEARDGLTIADLSRYHQLGWPVIVCVQDYMGRRDPKAEFDYGHYLTVVGTGFGYVFCQDSSLENWEGVPGGDVPKSKENEANIDAPGKIMVAEAEFLRVWHDRDIDGNKYVRWGCAVGFRENGLTGNESYFATCDRDAMGHCVGGGGATESKLGKIASFVKGLPSKAVEKVKTQVKAKYAKLSKRYGPTYAKAIIGAALVGLPIPLPGASFASASVVIAVAELHRLATGGPTHNLDAGMSDAEVQQAAKELIAELRREFGATTNAPAEFAFHSSPEQLKKFQAWLRKQYASLLTGKTEEELWQVYAEQGYKRGAGRAFDDVNSGYYATKINDEGGPDFVAGGRDQFLRSAFGRPETVEKIQLLASRSFLDLVNVTEDMATKMGRILVDGLVTGSNPRDVADEMDDVLDVGLARADAIARTEIIRAHAEGQLDAFDRLGVSEIGVEVEWSTAGDERVCLECEDMEGKIFSVDDAHGMIPLHPQCRCAFIPVVPTENVRRPRLPTLNVERIALRLADFVKLPDGVDGTNCGNCRFEKDGECSYHGPSRRDGTPIDLRGLKVDARHCCAEWDAPGTERPTKGAADR